jgi:hypothetical protein
LHTWYGRVPMHVTPHTLLGSWHGDTRLLCTWLQLAAPLAAREILRRERRLPGGLHARPVGARGQSMHLAKIVVFTATGAGGVAHRGYESCRRS